MANSTEQWGLGIQAAYTVRAHIRLKFGVLLLSVVLTRIAFTQEAIPLPVEDVLNVHSFADWVPARFSPDSKVLAYTVQDHRRKRLTSLRTLGNAGVPPWAVGADIYLSDIASQRSSNITGGEADNWFPAWSPDGRYLAFLSDRGDTDHARLWLWDRASKQLRMVSDVRVRMGPGGNDIVWTPDSRHILITADPEQPTSRPRANSSATVQRSCERSDSTVVLYSSESGSSQRKGEPISDPWDLDIFLRDLLLIDSADGSYRPLVHGKRISLYRLSPDGLYIAYTIPKRFERAGSQQIIFDLETVALNTGTDRALASDIRFDYDGAAFSWSPDSTRIVFRTGGSEEKAFDCYIVGAAGGAARNISTLPVAKARPAGKSGPPYWDPDGFSVYFLHDGALWRVGLEGQRTEKTEIPGRQIVRLLHRSENILWTLPGHQTAVITHDDIGKQDGVYRVDLVHRTSLKLLENRQCYTCTHLEEWQFPDVSNNGQNIAFYAEDAQHSADLWLSDSAFRTIKQLTDLNRQFDNVSLGAARLIEWQTSDGSRLNGALLLPSQYQKGKLYPLIVWVYGGHFQSNRLTQFGLGNEGPFNMQLLATRGYAILMPDAPQHLGTPMSDLAKTVMPGVDKVIDLGVADPERMGIMGHSYGSYCTLSLIVQSTRFKAAIAADGFGNLISAYGQMNAQGTAYLSSVMETGQGLMGGTPWQFRQQYIENSPYFYLDRADTPLLLVHGGEDTTVDSFLGNELFIALRRLGKTVEYAKYAGEEHSPADWSYANQLDLANRVIAWFDNYLKREKTGASADNPKPY